MRADVNPVINIGREVMPMDLPDLLKWNLESAISIVTEQNE